VSTLRKQLEQQKAQLEQLKAARAERLRQEEELALRELRRAVQTLQAVDHSRQEREQAVAETLGQLETRMQRVQAAELHQRAANLMQSIDYAAVASGEGSGIDGVPAAGSGGAPEARTAAPAVKAPPAGGKRRGGKA
jgi:hypothetical protein